MAGNAKLRIAERIVWPVSGIIDQSSSCSRKQSALYKGNPGTRYKLFLHSNYSQFPAAPLSGFETTSTTRARRHSDIAHIAMNLKVSEAQQFGGEIALSGSGAESSAEESHNGGNRMSRITT